MRLYRRVPLAALAVLTRAAASTTLPYPRGAVSCVLRLATEPPRYLLVRRGRPPNKGPWSLPGGKLELGESAVAGAVREISEETSLPPAALKVHPRPITATDAIVPNDAGGYLYHYCIVQCFAWVDAEYEDRVMPGDDAAAVRWHTMNELRDLPGEMGANVCAVVEISEGMCAAGLIAPPTGAE